MEEYSLRINELTQINVNLTSIKVKLEQELAAYSADYDEVTKELKVFSCFVVDLLFDN